MRVHMISWLSSQATIQTREALLVEINRTLSRRQHDTSHAVIVDDGLPPDSMCRHCGWVNATTPVYSRVQELKKALEGPQGEAVFNQYLNNRRSIVLFLRGDAPIFANTLQILWAEFKNLFIK